MTRKEVLDELRHPVKDDAVTTALASMLSTCTTSRSWAEQDEGPYHRGAQPLRRAIVEDREGVPLQLGVRMDLADQTFLRGRQHSDEAVMTGGGPS